MHLRLLNEKDDQALLTFELENKNWFESFIEAREPTFYSSEGIQQHIRNFLAQYRKSQRLPLLIISDNNEIIGRINLHQICTKTGSAYLGYRVGQASVNCGVASYAVKQILTLAQQKDIKCIKALASIVNKPSRNVLIKNGFQEKRLILNKAIVNGLQIDCIEYQISLNK
ncbi:GNAT family N-acetyltransferase [Zooshikella harenae]|uniref:GNAT family N-acetyltransferase n=1 Tax=Zooshikella harenae TaxID=2827238 RepID=A0ABS5ZE89_9GAMM|nr:GNAT family protein [Zooshikella harenae]MBU2712382.1 GNAT family N-acetyltransferase [Zooshikella harenae]